MRQKNKRLLAPFKRLLIPLHQSARKVPYQGCITFKNSKTKTKLFKIHLLKIVRVFHHKVIAV